MKKVSVTAALLAMLMFIGSPVLGQGGSPVTLKPNPSAPSKVVSALTSQPSTVLDGLVSGGITAATVSAAGTGYVPGDKQLLTDGAASIHGVLNIATTKVVSATVAAGGTGGTNGTQTVTGTTGTGTKFQASVTVSGNAITAVGSITTAGSYTVNPTDITQEPVTGASLVGAKLSVVLGADTATVDTAGVVTAVPSNPVAGTAQTGAGAGATWTATYAAIAQTLGAYPVNGWKVNNPNSSGDIWVTDNGVTPVANGASAFRVVANGGETKTAFGEAPPGVLLKLLGATIGNKFVARVW